MRNFITYCIFVIAGLAVIIIFTTSKSYTQLFFAMLLYVPLAFFAFRSFRGGTLSVEFNKPLIVVKTPIKPAQEHETSTSEVKKEVVAIADIDKRAFLKLVGGVGLSYFFFTLINRKIGGVLPGGAAVPETVALKDSAGNKINPVEKSPTDGYRITEIDDSAVVNYFGFTANDGTWYIMSQNTETGTFRYIRGASGFTNNWADREDLSYDYYNLVFKD